MDEQTTQKYIAENTMLKQQLEAERNKPQIVKDDNMIPMLFEKGFEMFGNYMTQSLENDRYISNNEKEVALKQAEADVEISKNTLTVVNKNDSRQFWFKTIVAVMAVGLLTTLVLVDKASSAVYSVVSILLATAFRNDITESIRAIKGNSTVNVKEYKKDNKLVE